MIGLIVDAILVDRIHAIAFVAFWLFLFVGAVSVSARVAFYRAKRYRMPRLLVRDAVVILGFALSFGMILVARVLPDSVRLGLQLSDNVLWALGTDIPAVIAVVTFVYFELFVIERGTTTRPEIRDLRGVEALAALDYLEANVPTEPADAGVDAPSEGDAR